MTDHQHATLRKGLLPTVVMRRPQTHQDINDTLRELEGVKGFTIDGYAEMELQFENYAITTYPNHVLVYIAGRWRSFTPEEFNAHFQETK